MLPNQPIVSAIVLAAGLSTRMGQPKMALPWGQTTVLGQVLSVLLSAGIQELIVVSGGAHDLVTEISIPFGAQVVFHPRYANGEMLDSLQAGMETLALTAQAFLLVLGDQPQIQVDTVRQIVATYHATHASLIVPSYQKRRGHPWLVASHLWAQLRALKPPQTLRDFLNSNAQGIHYLNVDTPTVLADLDTPEDYRRQAPV